MLTFSGVFHGSSLVSMANDMSRGVVYGALTEAAANCALCRGFLPVGVGDGVC